MSVWQSLDREYVRRALAIPSPVQSDEGSRSAAVSVVLGEGSRGVELLLIRRSERPSDPWSGHMALPGGHRESVDFSLLDTAVRETREEVGLDLVRDGELLGALDDVTPVTSVPLLVRPFVFALSAIPELTASPEVDQVLWANLGDLAAGTHGAEYELLRAGQKLRFPGFRVGDHIVWGLTYRVLGSLLSRAAALGPAPALPAPR